MEEWLQIPDRPKGIPAWRLCIIIALTLMIILLAAPVVFALVV